MTERITWGWLEESFFPLVVKDAAAAGIDVTGWALDSREGPGRALVKLNPDKSVAAVLMRFARPADADLFMQGLRFAWSRAADVRARDASDRQQAAQQQQQQS